MNKKILLGITVSLIVVASTVFATYDLNSSSTTEKTIDSKISISEFEEMRDIIDKVNSGELPISALKDAEALLERHTYYVMPETLNAYQELTQ